MIFSLSAPLRAPVVLLSEALGKLLSEATAQPRPHSPGFHPHSRLSSSSRTRCTLGSDPRSVLLSGGRASKRSSSPIPSLTRAVTETGHWWVSGLLSLSASASESFPSGFCLVD